MQTQLTEVERLMTCGPQNILTIREVANLLKMNEKTVYRLVADARIPGFKIGGSWRFDHATIAKWIEEGAAVPNESLTEVQYLRRLCELLQELRDSALAISDGMRRSKAGDCFTYEGGMNAVEMFRDKEAEIVSFKFHHRKGKRT